MTQKIDKTLFMVFLAESSERYDDMAAFLESRMETSFTDLTDEEKLLLSVAYKNQIIPLRNALSTVNTYEQQELANNETFYIEYIKEYKYKLFKELEKRCTHINVVVESYLIPKAETNEDKLFYYKMSGDYYRYVAEKADEFKKRRYCGYCYAMYAKAKEYADELERKCHVTRLEFVLNYSNYYFEVVGDKDKAVEVIKEGLKGVVGDDVKVEMTNEERYVLKALENNLKYYEMGGDNINNNNK